MREEELCSEEEQGFNFSDEGYFCIDGKRVAVVGSRDWGVHYHYDEHGKQIRTQDLSEIEEFIGSLPADVTIVSGGARGVDDAARRAARKFGLAYNEWPAEWNKYGKQAGYFRNHQIVFNSDCVVAFWDGVSKGTEHTINIAREQGKWVLVIKPG